jgi:hypothetical protein
MNNKKIAFGCQKRVGKSTSVEYLIKKYGGIELSFAKPLYDILYHAQKTCGFKQEKDRKFLQWVGTEWGRNIDKNVWIRLMEEKVEENKHKNIFVSDVRFKNEFRKMKELGFILVKIVRKGIENNDIHASENDLLSLDDSEWDCVIENNGSLEEFKQKLNTLTN